MYEQWHNRDINALTEMHASNAKYHHPSASMTPIPFEKALEAFQMYWKSFPDLTISVEDIISKGDKVVVRFIGRGTHKGDLGSIPATGLKTEAGAIEIFQIENGKITDVWEVSDSLGIMQQLSMELKPKEEK